MVLLLVLKAPVLIRCLIRSQPSGRPLDVADSNPALFIPAEDCSCGGRKDARNYRLICFGLRNMAGYLRWFTVYSL